MSEHSHDPTLIPPTVTYLAPPQNSGDIGRLAQYRILKQLGRGGMGIVYQAMDTQLNRVAALKVMHPEFAANEEARARFKREAQAVAALKHDHIVTIYQVGEEQQVPFLAMEFLDGKSLEEWLRPDRRATVAETLVVGKQIAKGLAAAHAAGLIHRDIKPGNLWLEAPRGRVKILDFGLARRAAGELVDLTQDGSVVGTPAYMAPEQARGEVVDQRCDLFSLGCVLYRMLAGRLPFQGSTMYAVLSAIASATPPSLRALSPEIPARFSDLVDCLLAKQANDRPASAQAVFDELLAIEKQSKQPLSPPSLLATTSQPRLPWPLLAAVSGAALLVLVVLVAAVASGFWSSKPKSAESAPATNLADLNTSTPETAPVELKAIRLLELVDLSRDRISGGWTVPVPARLRGHTKKGLFLIVLPWEPPSEYRLRLKVTRQDKAPGILLVGLSSGAHRFTMIFDSLPKRGHYSGLGFVDDIILEKRSDGNVGLVLPPKLPIAIDITVRKEQISVKANESIIYVWQGDFKRLSRASNHATDPLLLGGAADATFLFEEVILEPLGDDAGKLYER